MQTISFWTKVLFQRSIKQPLFIVKNGLGLVTKPKFISEEKVVGNKISVFEITDAKQAKEIKDKNELALPSNYG